MAAQSTGRRSCWRKESATSFSRPCQGQSYRRRDGFMRTKGPASSDAADFGRIYWQSAPAAAAPLPVLSPQSIDDATFRLLADNVPTLCWVANGDGYIVWYNRRWHDYCGTSHEQMVGRRPRSLVGRAGLHLPVRSYLAASVISRLGEVLGGSSLAIRSRASSQPDTRTWSRASPGRPRSPSTMPGCSRPRSA
jgi:PAS domain-containing protein